MWLAVWCDEVVGAVAADVYLQKTEHLNDMILCIGHFHRTYVLLGCQGKLLRCSGSDDVLVECCIFGPGVIELVLNGSQYARVLVWVLIVENLTR